MTDEALETIKLNIFLHKSNIKTYAGCLKESDDLGKHRINKKVTGLNGYIYLSEPKENTPYWGAYINKLSQDEIALRENVSNKAVLLTKVKSRFVSIVFGYGKSLLDESSIERNFGLRTALNLLDTDKLRSLKSMTIEDIIVDNHKQSSSLTSQNQFQVNSDTDVMKAVSGLPRRANIANFLVGSDSLIVTKKMDIKKVKDDLNFYIDEYKKGTYRSNGFEWVDHIMFIQDRQLCQELDTVLSEEIQGGDVEKIAIVVNQIIEWENLNGFSISGYQKTSDRKNYDMEIKAYEYLISIQNNSKGRPVKYILDKIKRDKLLYSNEDEIEITLGSVYNSLIFEVVYKKEQYQLIGGRWYKIEKEFYTKVDKFIRSIDISKLLFPDCERNSEGKYSEGHYNEKAVKENQDYCLMDKRLFQIKGFGNSSIEACDILTIDKEMVHVKFGGASSKLSHLFAQGLVSAKLLASQEEYRRYIDKITIDTFGLEVIGDDFNPKEFEIVFAIIGKRDKDLYDMLPFFTMVNMMVAIKELQEMSYKVSLLKINKED